MSNIISWWKVHNKVDEIMVDGSLRHTLKKTKKIKRRTRALNVELKKFANLKSYSKYITIKTEVLRNISDNEDTDDEPLERSAIVLRSSYIDDVQCDTQDGKNVPSEYEYEEEAEEQQFKSYDQIFKKTHPTITCTEIVKSKYTIIRDKGEKPVEERCNVSICPPDEPPLENEETTEWDTISDEAGHVGQFNDIDCSYDNGASEASQDTEEDPLDTTDNLLTEQKTSSKELSSLEITSETLDCDKWYSGQNDSGKKSKFYHSQDAEEDPLDTTDNFLKERKTSSKELSSRQITSETLDCDKWYSGENDSGEKRKFHHSQDSKYSSPLPSPLQVSDGHSAVDYTRKNDRDIRNEKSVKKSIKSQIAEQEFDDSSNEAIPRRGEGKSVANTVTNGVPSEAESLQYVLRNLSSSRSKDYPEDLSTEEIGYSTLNTSIPTTQCPMEVLPRPMELEEFVHQQRLIAAHELPTISINDIESSSEEDSNKELWLMEIPRSIATNGELLGKKIVLKRKKMKIGDVSYKTISRNTKTVSCILSVGKETSHFQTVNLRPVGSIVVRQEPYETDDNSSLLSLHQSSALRRSSTRGDLVPFPNNLKTRNPLVASNALNQQSQLDLTTSNED